MQRCVDVPVTHARQRSNARLSHSLRHEDTARQHLGTLRQLQLRQLWWTLLLATSQQTAPANLLMQPRCSLHQLNSSLPEVAALQLQPSESLEELKQTSSRCHLSELQMRNQMLPQGSCSTEKARLCSHRRTSLRCSYPPVL